MYDYEIEKFLLEIAYLNLGMVPPNHYPYSDMGSLDRSLLMLDNESARKSKRKFRKFLRRVKNKIGNDPTFNVKQNAVKWHITNVYLSVSLPNNYK